MLLASLLLNVVSYFLAMDMDLERMLSFLGSFRIQKQRQHDIPPCHHKPNVEQQFTGGVQSCIC